MTVKQIKDLQEAIWDFHVALPKRHREQLEGASRKIKRLKQGCDHTKPNGDSAADPDCEPRFCGYCGAGF